MSGFINRAARGVGWLLLVAGVLVVVAYGIYEFARDDSVSALIKTAMAAAAVGLVLMFISVLRQRLVERKTDRYREVEL